jgi:hypothetical protein
MEEDPDLLFGGSANDDRILTVLLLLDDFEGGIVEDHFDVDLDLAFAQGGLHFLLETGQTPCLELEVLGVGQLMHLHQKSQGILYLFILALFQMPLGGVVLLIEFIRVEVFGRD